MPVSLRDPITLGTLTLNNRLYRAPVLEGAGSAPNPAAVYARHFVPNVEAGLALVIQGNTIVNPEGRTSPGMSVIGDRARMLALKPLTDAVHRAGGRIITQLGHGGSFSLESWHREYVAVRSSPPFAPSPLPLWIRSLHRGGVHVMETHEVEALVKRFGVVAAWAREAGYDGVQLAGSNAKLLHQFLSPIHNRRKDRYGGDAIARTTLLREIREAIAREAGADYPVLLKYTAVEGTPVRQRRGISLEDGVQIAKVAAEVGFAAVTPVHADVVPNTSICRGHFPRGALRRKGIKHRLLSATGRRTRNLTLAAGLWLSTRRTPFEPVWNRAVFTAVKAAVSIPVFAVGGIRTAAEANAILREGQADMIGIGRPFYAEPDLARRLLNESDPNHSREAACKSCNQCLIPQMLGMPGVCYSPTVKLSLRHRDRAGSEHEAA